MDQYAVFGDPIAHSKSPDIHRAFASQTGQALEYNKTRVPLEAFSETAGNFFSQGGKGLNITSPLKLEAFRFAHRLTPRAQRAGAVNTLALQAEGEILGDNTDGAGLVSDIQEQLGWSVRGQRVLVLGAGGAVRGVLEPLLQAAPARLVIANRTVAKAEDLVALFAALTPAATDCEASAFEALAGAQFDLVINGTSASLAGDLPPLPDGLLSPGGACYDMAYAAEPTVFLRWAEQQGCTRRADGLGMLVGQAAESFALWRGVKPAVQPVIEALRAQLGGG